MDINNLFLGTQGTPKLPSSIPVKILGNIFAVAFLEGAQDFNHLETTVAFQHQFGIGVRFCLKTAVEI